MQLYPLPEKLKGAIVDDGLPIEQLITRLDKSGIFASLKDLIKMALRENAIAPAAGTPYPFLCTLGSEIPIEGRGGTESIFESVSLATGMQLQRPTIRSGLFLQEAMSKMGLYADIVLVSRPIDGGVPLITYEDDAGWCQSYCLSLPFAIDQWIYDEALFMFLPPSTN